LNVFGDGKLKRYEFQSDESIPVELLQEGGTTLQSYTHNLKASIWNEKELQH
jgi:hypothetical protein